MSNRLFIGMILPSVGVAALALAGAASAQQGGGPPPVPQGGARSQDVAAANRQVDSDYNTLAGRGVEVIDKSRADSRQKSALVAPATDPSGRVNSGSRPMRREPRHRVWAG